jgi:hypothetical protein
MRSIICKSPKLTTSNTAASVWLMSLIDRDEELVSYDSSSPFHLIGVRFHADTRKLIVK